MPREVSNRDRMAYEQAAELLDEGEPGQAFELLWELSEIYPDSIEISALLLKASLAVGDVAVSLSTARALQEAQSEDPSVRFDIGSAYQLAGFPALALQEVKEIDLRHLGREEIGYVRTLESELRRSLVQVPVGSTNGKSSFALNLDYDYVRLAIADGEFAKARRLAGELSADAPEFAPAHLAAANACYSAFDIEGARRSAARALELDPSDSTAFSFLLRTRFLSGEPLLSQEQFCVSLSSAALLDSFMVLILERRFAEAIAVFEDLPEDEWKLSVSREEFLAAYGFALVAADRRDKLDALRCRAAQEELFSDPRALGDWAFDLDFIAPGRITREVAVTFQTSPEELALVERWTSRYPWLSRLAQLLAEYSDDRAIAFALCVLVVTREPELHAALVDVTIGERFPYSFRLWLTMELSRFDLLPPGLVLRERSWSAEFSFGELRVVELTRHAHDVKLREVCDDILALLDKEKFSRAEKRCHEAIEQWREEPYLLCLLGQSLLLQDEELEAEKVWRQASAMFPQDVPLAVALANRAVDRGDWSEAEAFFREVFSRTEPVITPDMSVLVQSLLSYAMARKDEPLLRQSLEYLGQNSGGEVDAAELAEAKSLLEALQSRRQSRLLNDDEPKAMRKKRMLN